MRRLSAVILVVAVTTGFYLLLIDTVSFPELYAMAGIVLVAAAAFMASLESGFSEAAVKPRWLLRAWRPILSIPTQTLVVSWEALTQCVRPQGERGSFRTVAGAGDQPEDIGLRALVDPAQLWLRRRPDSALAEAAAGLRPRFPRPSALAPSLPPGIGGVTLASASNPGGPRSLSA
jgi:hypothetical protein